MTISPGGDRLDVVFTNGDKERALVMRDAQREYRYQDASSRSAYLRDSASDGG